MSVKPVPSSPANLPLQFGGGNGPGSQQAPRQYRGYPRIRERISMMDRGLLNFNGFPALNRICTASHFDPEPMRESQAGMTAATAGGQPITSGRSSSTRRELQGRYAKNCASSAHATPKSSMSRTLTSSGGRRIDSPSRHQSSTEGHPWRRAYLGRRDAESGTPYRAVYFVVWPKWPR
jgi:hypothetical protein